MASIMKQTAVWTGFPGAPGYSNFYHLISGGEAAAAQAGTNDVTNLFNDLQGFLPGTSSVIVDPVVQILNDLNGDVIGEVTVATPGPSVAGTSAGGYASNSGCAVEWGTGVFLNGKRLRGRTYLVPTAGTFDTDGTLTSGALGTLSSAASRIVNGTVQFVVWHRPVNNIGGVSHVIQSALVRDHAYVLRSRGR